MMPVSFEHKKCNSSSLIFPYIGVTVQSLGLVWGKSHRNHGKQCINDIVLELFWDTSNNLQGGNCGCVVFTILTTRTLGCEHLFYWTSLSLSYDSMSQNLWNYYKLLVETLLSWDNREVDTMQLTLLLSSCFFLNACIQHAELVGASRAFLRGKCALKCENMLSASGFDPGAPTVWPSQLEKTNKTKTKNDSLKYLTVQTG